MDTLKMLNDKVTALVGLVKDLKSANAQLDQERLQLQHEAEELRTEAEELRAENAKLAEENAQLLLQISGWQTSVVKDKEVAEGLVDELIKRIDSLVDIEHQQ